ncbi:YusW-like protein [Ornithinibacillus halophilus]|uniref:YusW-like protein n=1 Tax=Ornithinibacillus halophilus TaxID=930117 RepID=A0A1M5G4Q9_9BACI|nr:YusW-like protein [Ornithinibacillus halophilus]
MLSLFLVACGDSDEVENPPENATNEGQQETENNTNSTGDTEGNDGNTNNTEITEDSTTNSGYGFTNFELDADYDSIDDALDVDYENEKNDELEASYQDKAQDIDLKGDAAMEELDRIFSTFTFDENTSDDEVLNTVIEAFNLPVDAQEIELEIQFNSGTEKEYRR